MSDELAMKVEWVQSKGTVYEPCRGGTYNAAGSPKITRRKDWLTYGNQAREV